jgi:hypothetical protein
VIVRSLCKWSASPLLVHVWLVRERLTFIVVDMKFGTNTVSQLYLARARSPSSIRCERVHSLKVLTAQGVLIVRISFNIVKCVLLATVTFRDSVPKTVLVFFTTTWLLLDHALSIFTAVPISLSMPKTQVVIEGWVAFTLRRAIQVQTLLYSRLFGPRLIERERLLIDLGFRT